EAIRVAVAELTNRGINENIELILKEKAGEENKIVDTSKRADVIYKFIVLCIIFCIGKYFSVHVLVPFLGIFLAWLIADKTFKLSLKPMVPAFAVQAGYAFWLILGCLFLGRLDPFIDIMVLLGGLVWLILRPGLGPVIFLTIYHIIAFIVKVPFFVSSVVGSSLYKIMLVHMLLRASAVVLMFTGLRNMQNREK
ncbi:MAG: hypothetical protein PHE61_01890, partial [Candidatus Omnitrophica bacterium]|nr:hypothetical protein [Candidatus Omnitrophota bacterium]